MSQFSMYLFKVVDSRINTSMEIILKRDYAIIYEFLLDLLEKDDVVGPFLVRKKQNSSYNNADILLDLTKKFELHSFVRDPLLCLKILNNNDKKQKIHVFFNKNLSLISYKITESIWNAFSNGFSKSGIYVRGQQDDIYELTLSSCDLKSDRVTVTAKSENFTLKINLRILIKYTRSFKDEHKDSKPYPQHVLKRDRLAMVPLRKTHLFEVQMPYLEKEIKQKNFIMVMLQRFLRHLFGQKKYLNQLMYTFLDSTICSEYLEIIKDGKKLHNFYNNQKCFYILKGILVRLYFGFKSKKLPYFWNTNLNLIKHFQKDFIVNNIFQAINEFLTLTDRLNRAKELTYDDFIQYSGITMDPDKYEVDQFGIFKCF